MRYLKTLFAFVTTMIAAWLLIFLISWLAAWKTGFSLEFSTLIVLSVVGTASTIIHSGAVAIRSYRDDDV